MEEVWGGMLKNLNKNYKAVYLREGIPVIDKIQLSDEKCYYVDIPTRCKEFIKRVLFQVAEKPHKSFFDSNFRKRINNDVEILNKHIREMQDDIAVFNYLKKVKLEEDDRISFLINERDLLCDKIGKYKKLLEEISKVLKQEKKIAIALSLDRALKKI